MATAKGRASDRNLLLLLTAAMVVILIGVSVLAHTTEDTDMRPSADNTGAAGVRAAFVTLQELGVHVTRWDEPLAKLDSVQAANPAARCRHPAPSHHLCATPRRKDRENWRAPAK